MDSTLLITVVSGVVMALQILYILLGRKFGWTIYIKPVWLLIWFILFVGGIYSLVTGNRIIG